MGVKGAIDHIQNLIQFENYQIDQSENKRLMLVLLIQFYVKIYYQNWHNFYLIKNIKNISICFLRK